MSDSLKEQLIALGLAEDRPRRKPRGKPRAKKRRPVAKGTGAQSNSPGDGDISLQQAWRQRTDSERREVEDAKRRKREEDLKRRQVNARIQPIVEAHKLNDPAAELKRNFLYKGRIRSVLVTPEQLQALNDGSLGLVFLRGSYFILAPDIVAQVEAISPEHVPDLGGGDSEEEEHPVPDDMVW